MRWRVTLAVILAWILTVPLSLAHATLQQDYLNIFLKINDAQNLELKQGDYRGALEDYKDCYARLAKIHQSDPDWEKALVTHRMDDCKAKIIELQPKVDALPPEKPTPTPVAPAPPTNTDNNPIAPESVADLKFQLQAVKDELRITKEN